MEDWLVDSLNWLTRRINRLQKSRVTSPPGGWVIGSVDGREPSDRTALVRLEPGEIDRHLYLLGASGSGKSRLLELLIRQELQQGGGFCLVDPHGDLTGSVLAHLHEEVQQAQREGTPRDRGRIVLVEPFREDGIAGFNPLDPNGGPLHPHIGELVAILRRFWASSWGPRMEELLRTALLTLARSKLTLLEAIPLLTQADFRARVVGALDDEGLRAYWQQRYDPLSDAARAGFSEPVLNKLGALLADPRLRAMLGQTERCLNLRRLMDEGAWLLVNCSRGELRDASYLLGSFFVAQLQSAALSRANVPEETRRPFTVFVDEFQHFRGEDFESILCEARKFRLRLVIAHQHLGQIDGGLQNAVFGNVATQVFFALSPQDAAIAGRRLEDGAALGHRLIHQPVGHALVCRRGKPPAWTRVLHVEPPEVPRRLLSTFVASLRRRHGKSLSAAEAEIQARVAGPASPTAGADEGFPDPPVTARRRRRKSAPAAADPPPPAPSPQPKNAQIREAEDD